MKIFRILFLPCGLLAAVLFAQQTNAPITDTTTNSGSTSTATVASTASSNTVTIDGTTYEDVRWGRLTPATVTLYHRTGIATVPLASLPPELQKQFGYDPDKAAKWESAVEKTNAVRLAAEQKAAAEREAAERKAAEQKAAAEKAAAEKAAVAKTNAQKSAQSSSSTATNTPPPKRTIHNPLDAPPKRQ